MNKLINAVIKNIHAESTLNYASNIQMLCSHCKRYMPIPRQKLYFDVQISKVSNVACNFQNLHKTFEYCTRNVQNLLSTFKSYMQKVQKWNATFESYSAET